VSRQVIEEIELVVGPGEAGTRLDLFLIRYCKKHTRSQIQRLIDEGAILVNGEEKKRSYRVKEGERVKGLLKPPPEISLEPEEIPLDIVYEDEELVVVNKPPGMVVHPSSGHLKNTLVNALLHHCKMLSEGSALTRPGIVHRLDKGTSGLMVVAKNNFAHKTLGDQFQQHLIKKEYHALCWFEFEGSEKRITAPIGRNEKNRKKYAVTPAGKEAITTVKVAERFTGFTLVSASPLTGRTHQIRVHLSHLGHPLLGDPLYGGARLRGKLEEELIEMIKELNRPALHSARLGFYHPESGEYLEFSCPMPDDMKRIVDYLRENRGC
jgi:23S rRNA pseudouridine1911/1915/1917 synthase